MAKSCAPSLVRKFPEIFCLSFNGLRSRSPKLLVAGTRRGHEDKAMSHPDRYSTDTPSYDWGVVVFFLSSLLGVEGQGSDGGPKPPEVSVKSGNQGVNTLGGEGTMLIPGLLVGPDHLIEQGHHPVGPCLPFLDQTNTLSCQMSQTIGMVGLGHVLAVRPPVIMDGGGLECRHDITTALAQPQITKHLSRGQCETS